MTAFEFLNNGGAAVIIVLLPALIIGVGEFEERLRQRDSGYLGTVGIMRVWVLPLLTVWVLGRALFSIDSDNIALRLLVSAVVLALAATAWSLLGVFIGNVIARPPRPGRRGVPRLLLAVPRLMVILGAAWILIAEVWGVDLSAALTALGVTSLVISFALQDTLGGIASGFTLLADQPFAPGDWIESEGVEGHVVDVNWRSTRIQTRNLDLVVIPNGQLAKATIVNYDQPSSLHRVKVLVQIERTASPTAARAMLLEAARSTHGVLEDPPPDVRVTNIADPIVDYQTYLWIDDYAAVTRVQADFRSLVWYLSYRHGVPLPNPAQDLYVFDGARSALDAIRTPAEIRHSLESAPLFAEAPADLLDRLAASASIASYREGETIVVETRQHDVFVLDRGRAKMILRDPVGNELHVLDLGPGQIFGLVSDLTIRGHDVVVLAITDCEVVRVPAADTAELASNGQLAAAIDQLTGSRRRRCERVLRRASGTVVSLDGSGDLDPAADRDRGDG